MDFFRYKQKPNKDGTIELSPSFRIHPSKDIMIRAKEFYAIWNEKTGLWSTDAFDVKHIIDEMLWNEKRRLEAEGKIIHVRSIEDSDSGVWEAFLRFAKNYPGDYRQLDESLTFSNSVVKKEDYVSKRLPYPLEPGDYSAWDELVGTLYDPEERAKIEWAIGAILSGDSKNIQKFLVLYGSAGTGKSTILNIIQKLFAGYYAMFEAKALVGNNNSFSTEAFRYNPLVAIQHDGDLSRIEDNSKLNSIVSHEDMIINEKFKATYEARINAFLFMGTNKAVKITDAKSGLMRRLIDVEPTGNKIPNKHYQYLMSQVDFQLGAIAQHCLDTYRAMGKNYYSNYKPEKMMQKTDYFYNFVEAYFDDFNNSPGVTVKRAYHLYKEYCNEMGLEFKMNQMKLRDELQNYFHKFESRATVDDQRVSSWLSGFKAELFTQAGREEDLSHAYSLSMEETSSLFDREFAECTAQYANENEAPAHKWVNVSTKLHDLDTSKIHYVLVPENHIVIDFDLKDQNGNKSAERNLEAASQWPATYAEFSKGGGGIHLHYNYAGDISELARDFSEGVEVKVFTGNSSLRRRLSRCNNVPIATISTGLPLKEKKLINADAVKSEKALRDLIERNLRKEIHSGTKSSVDFIHKILEDAYASELRYDVTDMRPKILAFANNSTNQALAALKTVQMMKFQSKEAPEDQILSVDPPKDDRVVLFDVEVFPNLFMLNWMYEDSDNVVRMINPKPEQVEQVMKMKLVGYNCRRYDNHIIYGAMLGYNNEQLYKLSQKIINGEGGFFREAYNLSFYDLYDVASKKQSLKKWEIELGIPHKELGLPWDEPVAKEMWGQVGDYCDNDVRATRDVKKHIEQDIVARQILAELSGLPMNSTTQQHTAKIVFGDERNPQKDFIYTDLSEDFPGYKYDFGKSTYRGEETGEGGYVYAEPGMYSNVALLDVASMHPTSIENLDAFGPYTKNFSALKKARLAIKHGDYDSASKMLGGKLAPYLGDKENADALSYALKIVINIVYGLTSAKFDNPFRDPRNKDNIVAKRGALFMIDLKHFVQEQGFTVAHIKTDSIKIPDATPEIIEAVMEFGQQYGYDFEHEATYEKFCLVNDAVYIAKTKAGRKPSYWTATGAQFQHPYVFKSLFSHEDITFRDKCEEKHIKTGSGMYLDFSADHGPAFLDEGKPHFIGKAGLFCPIKEGKGGGLLVREKDGKYYAVQGTKGFTWMESEMVENLGKEDDIDMSYFEALADEAVSTLNKFGDFEWFVGENSVAA